MIIKLIDYTGKGRFDECWYAARLLQFTKNTRLELTPEAFEAFMAQKFDADVLQRELRYMAQTIASSWEFVHVTFAITDVSRACAEQIKRTRTASFAQQSQRVTDLSDATCYIPATAPNRLHYELALSLAMSSYEKLLAAGTSLEDARGVLPLNVHTNLIAGYNFRAWVDLVRTRNSLRVQQEYREVIGLMQAEVIRVWPWAKTFITPKHLQAIEIIEQIAQTMPEKERTQLAKAADLLKKETS